MKINIIFLIGLFSVLVPKMVFAMPAFPGAVGEGRDSLGGRGGAVIKVTTLADSGAGSLREALMASGPRIIVFEVSGNIDLTSILTVTNPYVTIAGQTSPGGIAVSGKQFNVATHDVVIRHMRFRSGGHRYAGDDSDGDSFSIWGAAWNGGNPVFNIIVDHCSFTWGTDETMSVTGGATKTTIQKSLIAQGLKYAKMGTSDHSKGLMVSGKYGYDTKVSLYRNYIAESGDRNPLIWNPFGSYQGDTVEATNTMAVDAQNNVLYNWYHGNRPMVGGWRTSLNWINNWSKEGPISNRYDAFLAVDDSSPDVPYSMVYLDDSYGINNTTNALFGGGLSWLVSDWYRFALIDSGFQQSNPFSFDIPLTSLDVDENLASEIVAQSGAIIPVRDSVDQLIVSDYANKTGTYPEAVSYPNDWPVYANILPLTDGDNDGMPDEYETTKGFNASLNDAALDFDEDGYTNIEEYINELADKQIDALAPASPLGLVVM